MFYNGARLLNSVGNFKFTLGSRGSGKSYFYKKYCIDNWIKNKRKFVFMRRYLTEIDLIKDGLFDDLEIEGNVTVNGYDILYNNEQCGLFIPLSSYNKYKSINLSEYDTLVFDEFLPEDERYLNKKSYSYEPEACLNFYQSVARGYNKPIREEVNFIFISNTIATLNPYSAYFKFDKLLYQGAKFIQKEFFTVEVYENKNVNKAILDTAFGRFIADTEYGSYALNNNFLLDNDALITKDVQKEREMLQLYVENEKYIMYRLKDGYYYLEYTKKDTTKKLNAYSLFFGEQLPMLQASNIYNVVKKLVLKSQVLCSCQKAMYVVKIIGGQ